jgi:hypothetical protein
MLFYDPDPTGRIPDPAIRFSCLTISLNGQYSNKTKYEIFAGRIKIKISKTKRFLHFPAKKTRKPGKEKKKMLHISNFISYALNKI